MTHTYSIHRMRYENIVRYASGDVATLSPRDFGAISRLSVKKESCMLWTIFVMLLILWFFGLVSSYTLGGYIHLLLVVAVIVLLVNLLTGRRGAI
jgi:hypothetical protein